MADKITVLGAGSWGTALALVLAENKNAMIKMWGRPKRIQAIAEAGENSAYLKGIPFPANIEVTDSLEEALHQSEMVVSVVPAQTVRATWEEAKKYVNDDVPIVSASKGIEVGSLMLMSDVFEDVLGKKSRDSMVYLSGPSFARETAEKTITAVVLASHNQALAVRIQHLFHCDYFRTYTSEDVVGVEVGGAVKNVIAIASGCCSGMGLGLNSSCALLTRGLAEITRLAVAQGANPLTLLGLSGVGDLSLTCMGGLSRNREVGVRLGKGQTLEQILSDMNMVAEGVQTTRSTWELAQKLKVDMPITEQMHQVLFENLPVKQGVQNLLNRKLSSE